ncbi:P-loop containing nucleoside triphosphate hydrolase protein [Helicostylum pulchrum]|uniref:Uncharacterized protein n=1 Tax=Helicostylum pulchrum TaxID=562976 RepID=A0ABP9Y903_9FUNG|nr:P-loop containing nucleoside triphosphate hydrolase protein [Helicostylum pulchrum]
MAPIKVIGASLGRSGTESLRVALDILGYKTHHMKCFFEDPTIKASDWLHAYYNRETTDWDKLYEKFDACTDWTAATFYKELLHKYPDAKVLLTIRPVDSWYESVKNTILKSVEEMHDSGPSDPLHNFLKLADAVCMDGWIRNPEKFADEKTVKRLYNEHVAEVKRVVPADQLCVLELGDGWEKLCKFLGKEVPQVPYPKVNTTDEFKEYFFERKGANNLAPVTSST